MRQFSACALLLALAIAAPALSARADSPAAVASQEVRVYGTLKFVKDGDQTTVTITAKDGKVTLLADNAVAQAADVLDGKFVRALGTLAGDTLTATVIGEIQVKPGAK